MGANAERMMASMGKRTGGGSGGAFIGFDEKDIKKEFERAFKELENLHDGVTTAQIRRIARKSLKPMLKGYKDEITNIKSGTFKVYRNGGIYAEITKGK
jgi:cell pole-organizing protein PopZ